jgi:putative peptide zinc metalloprotease protein
MAHRQTGCWQKLVAFMQNTPAATWSTKFVARRDLRLQLISEDAGRSVFNVLDPLTRQSYRIGDLERSLLRLLDGQRTLAQVFRLLRSGADRPETGFTDLTESRLLAIVAQFRKSGLIRGERLTDNAPSSVVRGQSLLSSLVVWQVRGLQPDALLGRLAPYTNALFSGVAVRVWLLLAFITCCVVLLEFPRLASQGSAWQWVLHPAQGTALFIVFLLTRAIHELGHAFVCKRHGVRCPDIGLFVILGAPCVYCDVTESWQLPSRWHRAAVAAAGMYVELILATLAAWVWMLTIDGPVNTIALQTMFVCSISTLIINANPLMRFDGYYLLSDLVDEPNLRSRADQIALSQFYRWILGRKCGSYVSSRLSLKDHLLSLFSWCSWVYRGGVSLAIASVLAAIYSSWNLAWLGRVLAICILVSWWGVPSVKFIMELTKTARRTNTAWRLAAIASLVVIAIVYLPVPYRQFARGWVQPASMRGVYVATPGQLEECLAASGDFVAGQQPLFRLHNPRLVRLAVQRQGDYLRAEEQLETQKQISLSSLRSYDFTTFETAAENAKQQAENAQEELQRLTLVAPCSGQLIVMPVNLPASAVEQESQLITHSWDDGTQLQRHVRAGTMLAAVCSTQHTAVLPLDDEQLEWISAGIPVRVRCMGRSDTVHTCKVTAIVRLSEATASWRLIHATGQTGASNGAAASALPAAATTNAAYAALVQLPEGPPLPLGSTVEGSFVAPNQTLVRLGTRWLRRNLRWLAD